MRVLLAESTLRRYSRNWLPDKSSRSNQGLGGCRLLLAQAVILNR